MQQALGLIQSNTRTSLPLARSKQLRENTTRGRKDPGAATPPAGPGGGKAGRRAAAHLGLHHFVVRGRRVEASAAAASAAVPVAGALPAGGRAASGLRALPALHGLVAAVVQAGPLVGEQRHGLVDVVLGQAQGLADGGGVREAHAEQRGHVLLLLALHGGAGGRRGRGAQALPAPRAAMLTGAPLPSAAAAAAAPPRSARALTHTRLSPALGPEAAAKLGRGAPASRDGGSSVGA